MPPRDEESRFEHVLARHLRHGANAGCPDAETLAAYHERGLTAEEMNAFKGHIAACGRCQEVLAGLEASEGVTAREKDELYAASFASARAATAMPAAEVVRERPKRTWKWMAPAAAVAAGILVWVALRETPRAPVETTTVAVNKQPAGATEGDRASPELKAQAPAQSADGRASTANKPAEVLPAAPSPASSSGARKEADELTAQLSAGKDQGLYQKVPRQDENAKTQQYGNSGRAENQVSTRMKQPAAGDVNAAQENLKAPALQSAQVGMESGKKEAGQQVAMDNAPANSSEYQYRAGRVTAEKAKPAAPEDQQRQAQGDKDTVAVTAAGSSETKTV